MFLGSFVEKFLILFRLFGHFEQRASENGCMFLIYSLFAFWLPLFPLAEKIVNTIFEIRYSTLSDDRAQCR
jgi:hypothetical protein